MEKWTRNLSKTTALILGITGLVPIIFIYAIFGTYVSGLIPLIILCALMGGCVGFSFPLIFKGITGYTPQERKELKQKPD